MIGSLPTLRLVPPLADGSRSDDELMLLSRSGHREAFSVLVERYLPRLVQFCTKLVADPRAGEELAQEVLLDAWKYRTTYRPQGRFAPFLWTLARNACRTHARDRERRARWHSDAPAIGTTGEGAASLELLVEKERTRLVQEACGQLTQKLREALLLRFDQGLDYADIAAILECNESTARSRVFQALKSLRSTLAPEISA